MNGRQLTLARGKGERHWCPANKTEKRERRKQRYSFSRVFALFAVPPLNYGRQLARLSEAVEKPAGGRFCSRFLFLNYGRKRGSYQSQWRNPLAGGFVRG
jgi:hypothetical protein